MTAARTFDDLRIACHAHNREGRHEDALAAAEEAWRRFPERRHFTWWLVAYTNLALGRPAGALAALEEAEAQNHLWRTGILRHGVFEPLRAEPRFTALLGRAEARIAAHGFRPRLLVAEPDPPGSGAPLLLGLHGATSTADDYHDHWLPAVGLGCIVASVQSSQPATESAFCWDDRDQVRRDLAAILPEVPAHGQVVLAGFSQGAAIALELALAGDVVPASGVIGVAPSYPPGTRFPDAKRPLSVVILRGSEDDWGRSVPGTVDALRAAGHHVQAEEVPGLGHDYPADFADRLPALLAAAGVRAP
jgi:dienelactone hydrolase